VGGSEGEEEEMTDEELLSILAHALRTFVPAGSMAEFLVDEYGAVKAELFATRMLEIYKSQTITN